MLSRSIYIVIAGLVFFASQDVSVEATNTTTSTLSASSTPSSLASTPLSSSMYVSVEATNSTTSTLSASSTPSSLASTPLSSSMYSLVDAVDTTTTTLTATPTVTPSATPANQTAATLTVTPTASTSAGGSASMTSSPGVTIAPTTSAGGAATVTSSPGVTPTEASGKKTCGSISFTIVTAWNESLYKNQTYVTKYETDLEMWLEKGFFKESSKYKDIKVSDVEFSKKEGNVGLKFKLCLVLKQNDVGYIEDKFEAGFKYNDMKVKDFEFKADGVSFKDWEAKDDECSKCSDGGGGPFIIEGTCVPEGDNSCNGLKTTEKSEECVKYCNSSAAVIVMCSSMLAMGILLSFSFNIWM